ncbi:MAG: aminotransferase class I/II-fold pyridoxal phosphate-dependent enzyme [Desulfobacteraceae bacterium]
MKNNISNENERIFLSPPHMSGNEKKFVSDAFASNYIAPLGPQLDAFERAFSQYTGIKYCVALTSGTAAIHLALQLVGVQPGDEVFASTLTFIGSVTPVTFLGAKPVFIDCDRKTWNMDLDLLAAELKRCHGLGRLPKAVIPTDLYGQCVDYDRIYDICDRYGVPVVVDAAEALGAIYASRRNGKIHAGKGAKAAIFSFNGNKIITTSGGGMLASDDEALIAKARFLSQQARDPFPHYEHSEVGYNYRLSNISAAIGLGQLKVLDSRVNRKREIFDYYRKALGDLPGVEFMPEAVYGQCTRWLTVILITPDLFGADREAVRSALEAENIESRPVWKPMHLQPVFDVNGIGCRKSPHNGKKPYPARVVGGAVSKDLFERGLCLPSGTAMSLSDLRRVTKIVKAQVHAKLP